MIGAAELFIKYSYGFIFCALRLYSRIVQCEKIRKIDVYYYIDFSRSSPVSKSRGGGGGGSP